MSNSPLPLYDICIKAAVADCLTYCKFCRKEFRSLPNNVLFDFYYNMFLEKRLCLLAVEFGNFEVFTRLLPVKLQRTKLLKCFQSLIDHHGGNVPDSLINNYLIASKDPDLHSTTVIDNGLRIGVFLNEGGWFNYSIKILSITETSCKRLPRTENILRKLLDCYHKKIYAEVIYSDFNAAIDTFELAQEVILELEKLGSVPNLAALYSNFSALFFMKSEYDKALDWSKKALVLLNDKLPTRVVVDVLRQASRSCVVKRCLKQAGFLIRQALNLASGLYAIDNHPRFADTLIDYGFFLLNYDSIQECVRVYERALLIRKETFEKHNILVALAHEDMAYALYVHEYSSGRFYAARENAERSLRIMEKILPSDHLHIASTKRVKALILEEIALDLREPQNLELQSEYLTESEELHKQALSLSFKAFGEKNVQTAKHYGNLGRLYQSMKKYDEAEKMHLKAIEIKEELLGESDYEVGLSIGHLASLYNYHMRRWTEAEKLYKRSIEINVSLFGETYSGLEYDYRGIIHTYIKLLDSMNVVNYTQKMRDWRNLREKVSAETVKQEVLPLSEIVSTFFGNF